MFVAKNMKNFTSMDLLRNRSVKHVHCDIDATVLDKLSPSDLPDRKHYWPGNRYVDSSWKT